MKILKSPKDLVEALLRLDTIESSLKEEMFDGAVVASSDQENLMTKIDTIRRQIRQEADDVTVEAMQQLMTQLRNVVHTLTDLIYAKAARGENSKPLSKFQDMIATIVKSLALPGDDEQDSNRDGFKDDVELPSILDDEDVDDHSDLKKAVNFATKQARKVSDIDDAEDSDEEPAADDDTDEQSKTPDDEPVDEEQEPKKEAPVKETPEDEEPAAEDDQDQDQDQDRDQDQESAPEDTDNTNDEKVGDGTEESEDDSNEGFMSNLLKQDAEEEADKSKGKKKKAKADEEVLDETPVNVTTAMINGTVGVVTTAGLRFLYYGIRNVRAAGGKPYKALKTAFGNTHSSDVTFYYYTLNTDKDSPLFGGSYEKVDKTFVKLLHSTNGYAALSAQINNLVRNGALVIAGRSKSTIAEAVNDDPAPYWAFTGIGPNPKTKTQNAIWLELGTQRYAIVPVDKSEYKEIGTISTLLKAILVGGKDSGGSGTPYDIGYDLAEQLLKTGTLKGVKTKFKTIYVEKVK